MSFYTFLAGLTLAATVSACPGHNNHQSFGIKARQNTPNVTESQSDWTYEASYDWGRLNPEYVLCQSGTQQSPISLSLSNGLSLNHQPTFDYSGNVTGNFYNWNYGPAFTVAHPEGVWTDNPSFTYDNETTYLKGWHIHAPSDHIVGGVRSKAEMHFVHVDAEGHEKAVVAFRLDPGNADNEFFSQLPSMIGFNETGTTQEISMDLRPAFESALWFNEFWTYQGSLTSPPCHEGIRWFVARQIMFTGVDQMRSILAASTYSARAEQQVWQHRINE